MMWLERRKRPCSPDRAAHQAHAACVTVGCTVPDFSDAPPQLRKFFVVTGVSTNNCVSMTAMEASGRQYGVLPVSDATGTCSDEIQSSTEKTFRRMWGRVLDTAQVIAEMQSTVR